MIFIYKTVMKKEFLLFFLVPLLILLQGCNSDDSINRSDCNVDLQVEGSSVISCRNSLGTNEVALNREQDLFVWQAMNLWYYWQGESSNLADDRFSSYDQLNTYLNDFASSEEMYSKGLILENDRFSRIVDDYDQLEASFQGIRTSFGFEFGLIPLSEQNLFGYVKYVVDGSPADQAGLKRGDLFLEVDDTQLTRTNFRSLLFTNPSIIIKLASITNDVINNTDKKFAITAVELTEDPIHTSIVFNNLGGPRVGYLLYNQFVNNTSAHVALNDVFGEFKSEGITDLILDLRYNGGGSLQTSRILSSLIYGAASKETLLGSLVHNKKISGILNSDISFLEDISTINSNGEETGKLPMNRLSLNRIFILTTGSTASASEFIIAGLDPYLTVTQIGTTTVGKNVGSVTLYDSPSTGYADKGSDLNASHKYAIQPIVNQLANAVGFTDYIDGLAPDFEVNEIDYLEEGLKPLGDPSEPLLAEALAIITTNARLERKPPTGNVEFFNSLDRKQSIRTINIDGEHKRRLLEHLQSSFK